VRLSRASGCRQGEALKPSEYRKQYRLFIARLRQAREEAGLTQVDAARRVGRPQSFISKCESGERRVDVVELQQFAEIYRKEIGFFLG
jgi:transcriptional regulator with XRE-family HTH domain